jgi:hypothetical protein
MKDLVSGADAEDPTLKLQTLLCESSKKLDLLTKLSYWSVEKPTRHARADGKSFEKTA